MRLLLPVLGLLAGGCLMLGSVLDWSGVAYSSTLDRRIGFAAGVLMAVLVAAALLWRPRVLVLALAVGAVGLNMGVVNYRDIDGKQYEYSGYPEASVGLGIYLLLVGGALALVVGAGALLPRRWLGWERRLPLDS